jgi:hypothetical protein
VSINKTFHLSYIQETSNIIFGNMFSRNKNNTLHMFCLGLKFEQLNEKKTWYKNMSRFRRECEWVNELEREREREREMKSSL